jgi:peptidylprolyl isomerase/FKBP-type peptidyl-prolyl cis-trans isomerase FklB
MHRRLLIASLLALSAAACKKPESAGPSAAQTIADGKAYLAKNGKLPGVVTTASGLQYKVISSGPPTGPHPKPSDEVKVNYEGRLIDKDRTVFDSSYKDGTPIIFVLNQVVPGWTEALQLMKPGDKWEIWLPPNLGYGDQDKGAIPPNSVLDFKIELIDIFAHPG